jgi:hypothetical protein
MRRNAKKIGRWRPGSWLLGYSRSLFAARQRRGDPASAHVLVVEPGRMYEGVDVVQKRLRSGFAVWPFPFPGFSQEGDAAEGSIATSSHPWRVAPPEAELRQSFFFKRAGPVY